MTTIIIFSLGFIMGCCVSVTSVFIGYSYSERGRRIKNEKNKTCKRGKVMYPVDYEGVRG